MRFAKITKDDFKTNEAFRFELKRAFLECAKITGLKDPETFYMCEVNHNTYTVCFRALGANGALREAFLPGEFLFNREAWIVEFETQQKELERKMLAKLKECYPDD